MDYKQLSNNVDEVRKSIKALLDFLTNRTLNDLKTRKRSKEIDYNNYLDIGSNTYSSNNFHFIFREEIGVYLFEAKFSKHYDNWLNKAGSSQTSNSKDKWFEEIKRLWSGVDKSPLFYKNRAIHHFSNEENNKFVDEWIPLYVGKAKNIQDRIFQHIEGMSPSTYSMKLSDRNELMSAIQLRVSYSCLSELDDDTMFELVKVIENRVREEFQPIIGKK